MNAFKAIIILALVFISGCGFSEYGEKENARKEAVVTAIQEAESNRANINTRSSMALLFALLQDQGKYVKVVGWDCNKNPEDSSYDVWFKVSVNDVLKEFHWVVTSDEIIPANDLAQAVTKRQKIAK